MPPMPLRASQREADRDPPAQGHLGDAPVALAQRRVRQLRDHVGSARQPAGSHSAHRRQLCPAGAEGRARHAGRQGLQPVQIRFRRRVRLAQHRRAVPSGQHVRWPLLLRMGRSRHACPATLVGGMFDARIEGTAGLDRRVGRGEHARVACSRACSARRPSASAVRTSRSVCSVAGNTPRTCWPAANWVKTGYAKGVPMGGDLPPAKAKAPTFMVWAVKDPTSGNLDRIQIVKGWAKNGQSFEKIFDVVLGRRSQARQADRRVPPDRQHGRHRERDLHEHDRRV